VPYLSLKQLLTTVHRHGYTFRKEGHTKIIEYDLSSKHKKEHQAMDLVRPDVLHAHGPSTRQNGDVLGDESGSESEDEPAGQSTFSDHEMDVDQEGPTVHQVAKSASGKTKGARGRDERVMPPEECRQHLRRLFTNEQRMCALIYGRHGPFASVDKKGYSSAQADMFFMDVVLVPPTRFRPAAKMGEMLFEHQQNELLGKILQTSYRLRDINADIDAAALKSSDVTPEARLRLITTFLDTLITLQNDVNSFVDSSKNPTPMRQGKLPPSGVKQLLEKKEGLFRKNMMVSQRVSPS
jgi:DNA-directed RNA polymerase beta' subunit